MPKSHKGLGGYVGALPAFGGVLKPNDILQSEVTYLPLTFTASSNISVGGNGTTSVSIIKRSGSFAWDSQAYTAQSYTRPLTLEFNKIASITDNGQSYAMIGLNTDPTTDASYSSIDYASYPFTEERYEIYNNGSLISPTPKWSQSKKFYIVYCGDGTLKHYNGSTLLYSVDYGNNTVYIDSSMYSVNDFSGGFNNVRLTKREWNGLRYV